MGDPSHRIDPFLLNHLHLISLYPFPKIPHLQIQNIIQYLAQANHIVNNERAVTWQYFSSPPDDGTLFLEWIPLPRASQFSSDGYLWGESERGQERDLSKELNGDFVLEIVVQNLGFAPQREQVASHSRHRYRIRKRDGAQSQFNPHLWLVHYKPLEPQYRIPISNIPPNHLLHQIINERNTIQAQGQLQKREFMLPDRSSWPQISFPPRRAPSQQQFPQQGFPPGAQQVPGPPAKRPRQSGPAATMRAPAALPHDNELEEAEDTLAGDFLDYITPATVSRMRFRTHHLWFEEVFSSIHSLKQIVPEDMGFGLVGELGDLTQDILSPPSNQLLKAGDEKGRKLDASAPYKPLDAEKLAQFEKRVQDYVTAKEQEIEEMRQSHSKIVSQLNKGKFYLDAEERLKAAGTDSAKIDEIVREVELKMGISLEERKDVVCVEPGPTTQEPDDDKIINPPPPPPKEPIVEDNTAAGLLDEFTSNDAGDLMDDITMEVDIPLADTEPSVPEHVPSKKEEDWVMVDKQSEEISKPAEQPVQSESTPVPAVETGTNSNDEANVDDMLQPDSMFESTDFTNFEGMEGNNYTEDNADGLLDFDNGFGGDTTTDQ